MSREGEDELPAVHVWNVNTLPQVEPQRSRAELLFHQCYAALSNILMSDEYAWYENQEAKAVGKQ